MTKSLSAHRRTNRPGLTLVEVLVVVSIVGMLAAIAIPAVNAAREVGRRNTCTNNFHQFGVGLISFETAHGVYPSAESNGPYFRSKPEFPFSIFIAPHVFMLPHLGLNDVYDSFDFHWETVGFFDVHDSPMAWERISLFRCPSDPEEPDIRWGSNNIRTCYGVYESDYRRTANGIAPGLLSGPIHTGFFISSGGVIDGISRTVAASERLLGSFGAGGFDQRRDLWHLGLPNPVGDVDQIVSLCNSLTVANPVYRAESGYSWTRSGFDTTWYNHAATPNAKIPDCTRHSNKVSPLDLPTSFILDEGSYRATSNHPGGVNVVFLDGHTEFVTDEVNLTIWRAYSTIAAGD